MTSMPYFQRINKDILSREKVSASQSLKHMSNQKTRNAKRIQSSKLSTHYTQSSLSKSRKLQKMLVRENSQSKSIRNSQIQFLKNINQSRREVETQLKELTDKKITFNEIIKNVTREVNSSKPCDRVKQSMSNVQLQSDLPKRSMSRTKMKQQQMTKDRSQLLMRSIRNY